MDMTPSESAKTRSQINETTLQSLKELLVAQNKLLRRLVEDGPDPAADYARHVSRTAKKPNEEPILPLDPVWTLPSPKWRATARDTEQFTNAIGDNWKLRSDGRFLLPFQQESLESNFPDSKAAILQLTKTKAAIKRLLHNCGQMYVLEPFLTGKRRSLPYYSRFDLSTTTGTAASKEERDLHYISVPTHRIIMCQGLTYLPREDVTNIFSNLEHQPQLRNALDRHCHCDMKAPDSANQHLVEFRWYEIFDGGRDETLSPPASKVCSTWRNGPLWASDSSILGEISFVMQAYTHEKNPNYWTLVVLGPPGSSFDSLPNTDIDNLQNRMEWFMKLVFERIQRAANRMLIHLEKISSEELSNMFQPDSYKPTDFEMQSANSRKYAWIVAISMAYRDRLEQAIQTLKQLPTARTSVSGMIPEGPSPQSAFQKKWEGSFASLSRDFEARLSNTMFQRDQMNSSTAEAQTRSAAELVKSNRLVLEESKKATHLGENVRLLTYVSIFFLPLSFVSSFWAVSNAQFHVPHFGGYVGGTMAAVAVPTYILVFVLVRYWASRQPQSGDLEYYHNRQRFNMQKNYSYFQPDLMEEKKDHSKTLVLMDGKAVLVEPEKAETSTTRVPRRVPGQFDPPLGFKGVLSKKIPGLNVDATNGKKDVEAARDTKDISEVMTISK